MNEIVRIEGLSKTFPGTKALDRVDIAVRSGEVHALLGHNGSGKSTLIKVLAGYHAPDPGGRVFLDGTEVSFEVGGSLLKGWNFRTIVQGSSVPQQMVPRLIAMWQQGQFPIDKLVETYDFADINTAFDDSESGAVVKPLLVF